MRLSPPLSDDQLRAMAQQRIADGVLPSDDRRDLAASYGTGKTCRLCEQPIDQGQIEYELTDGGRGRLSLHRACYSAWQVEIRAIANKAQGS